MQYKNIVIDADDFDLKDSMTITKIIDAYVEELGLWDKSGYNKLTEVTVKNWRIDVALRADNAN